MVFDRGDILQTIAQRQARNMDLDDVRLVHGLQERLRKLDKLFTESKAQYRALTHKSFGARSCPPVIVGG
jgi:hypothetical protein